MMSPKKIKKNVLSLEKIFISSHSFFHYLSFQRPLTSTARSGCGLYSLVYFKIAILCKVIFFTQSGGGVGHSLHGRLVLVL